MTDSGASGDAGEDTELYWQEFLADPPPLVPPFSASYPVRLPNRRWLVLPLRQPPSLGGKRAAASLIVNQASLSVEDALISAMAEIAFPLLPQMIVGLPTLGLSLARGVAKALGHKRYVALGYSRKFWYRDDLSVPVRSITSPGEEKKIYIDPRLAPGIRGRKVMIVDDVISSGATAAAVIPFLERLGAEPLAVLVAMRQGRRWVRAFEALGEDWPERVRGVFDTPLFGPVEGGWAPIDGE